MSNHASVQLIARSKLVDHFTVCFENYTVVALMSEREALMSEREAGN